MLEITLSSFSLFSWLINLFLDEIRPTSGRINLKYPEFIIITSRVCNIQIWIYPKLLSYQEIFLVQAQIYLEIY